MKMIIDRVTNIKVGAMTVSINPESELPVYTVELCISADIDLDSQYTYITLRSNNEINVDAYEGFVSDH